MNYTRLNSTTGDYIRSIKINNDDWTFTNLYEVPVYYKILIKGSKIPEGLNFLNSGEKVSVNAPVGSIFQVLDVRAHRSLGSYMLTHLEKDIYIGTVDYDYSGGNSNQVSLTADTIGIIIVNKLTVPLNMYYKGALMARILPSDGRGYFGGGGNSLYFNNNSKGLYKDDELIFTYPAPRLIEGLVRQEDIKFGETGKLGIPGNEERLLTVKLADIRIGKMYVGGIGPDRSVYRKDTPLYHPDSRNDNMMGWYQTDGKYNTSMRS